MENFALFNIKEFDDTRQIVIPGWRGTCPKDYQWVKDYWDKQVKECKAQLLITPSMTCPKFARTYLKGNKAHFQFLFLKKGKDGRYYKKPLDEAEALKKINCIFNNRVKVKQVAFSHRPSISPNDVSESPNDVS